MAGSSESDFDSVAENILRYLILEDLHVAFLFMPILNFIYCARVKFLWSNSSSIIFL